MGEAPPRIELPIRVYLEDTDAGGIVYHASYLRFMERARTEMLRATGMQQSETFTEGVSFVVHSMQLSFPRAARLDDELLVSCEVERVRAASLEFAQRVSLGAGGDDCCVAAVKVACIDLASGRARRIPPALVARLSAR